MRKFIKTLVLLAIVVFILINIKTLFSSNRDVVSEENPATTSQTMSHNETSSADSVGKLLDVNYELRTPLLFPVQNIEKEMILDLPDSRLPGAPRSYRGAFAKHKGIDIYTEECGLDIVAPADGWVIDLNANENFPASDIRDSILSITSEAGFTPQPILDNLHGRSIALYHGKDNNGNYCYSRLSHLETFSKDWQLGDYINRGATIGTVGASGTSYNFKPDEEKKWGCHLHFEWHQMKNGEDVSLALDERDNDIKRRMYFELFE